MRYALLTFSAVVLGATTLSAQTLERINPPGFSTPATYSHIVNAGETLYIAGRVSARADGTLAGETMTAQLERAGEPSDGAEVSGRRLSHIAKITIYVTSISEFRAPEAAKVRAKYFGGTHPASTLVQIQQLANPAYKVEIEAIAVLPGRRGITSGIDETVTMRLGRRSSCWLSSAHWGLMRTLSRWRSAQGDSRTISRYMTTYPDRTEVCHTACGFVRRILVA